MNIKQAFTELANDEGSVHSLNELQSLQGSMETILECGSTYEKSAATFLLKRINLAIDSLLPKKDHNEEDGSPPSQISS